MRAGSDNFSGLNHVANDSNLNSDGNGFLDNDTKSIDTG